MTAAARKTEISAHGPSMFPWFRSAIVPSGKFRGSGPTTLTTQAPATPIAQGREDVSTVTELLCFGGEAPESPNATKEKYARLVVNQSRKAKEGEGQKLGPI